MLTCQNCQKTFKAKDPRTQTCSRECNTELRRKNKPNITKNCLYCGEAINLKKDYHKKFCDSSCSAKHNNKHRIWTSDSKQKLRDKAGHLARFYEENRKFLKPGGFNKKNRGSSTCERCGITFAIKVSHRNARYCSPSCAGGTTRQRHIYKGEELDSSWELKLAMDLDANGIEWKRCKYPIAVGDRKFTPDFYLPRYNAYLEPKSLNLYRMNVNRGDKLMKLLEEFAKSHRLVLITRKEDCTWDFVKNIFDMEQLKGHDPSASTLARSRSTN